ncbi:tRNA (adenine(22)-N(1))-methyltransferase TrmK [Clostridium sediminicola]|uniref:tRNA (adenine(22)-N(1))-methyltransferase n=1 Tax=Clostridium sediminicola TaxID=3114879 RepID=UPI0031F1ED1C
MIISDRIKNIAKLVDECYSIVDVGTDHAYLPIYLINKGVVKTAIASDINKGPVLRAQENVKKNKVDNFIQCRHGAGLQTVKPCEVDIAVIAGMGGNLIRDILEDDIAVVQSLKYLILQPVQNPEVLREYLYRRGYNIIDEELCYDEGKYYEIIKAKLIGKNNKIEKRNINYTIGEKLIQKRHPLVREYISFRIDKYKKIISFINDDGESSSKRKNQLLQYIKDLEELLKCL